MTSSFLSFAGFLLALSFVGPGQQRSCDTKAVDSSRPSGTDQVNAQSGGFVLSGVWGGDHVRIEVSDTGANIEYDCAHGQISERLTLDSGGRFHAKGTHVREHGGPVRNDEAPASHPAEFSGRVSGNQMTLTVTLANSSEAVGTFTLVRGNEGNLTKCR